MNLIARAWAKLCEDLKANGDEVESQDPESAFYLGWAMAASYINGGVKPNAIIIEARNRAAAKLTDGGSLN